MQVKDILDESHRHPRTICEDGTIEEAMKELQENRIGSLLVTSRNGNLVGIITERDIFRMTYELRGHIMDKKIADYMSTNLIIGLPDDDLDYIAGLITQNRIRHIPIVDKGNTIAGVVSIGDIVKSRMDKAEVQVRYLKEFITGRQHRSHE